MLEPELLPEDDPYPEDDPRGDVRTMLDTLRREEDDDRDWDSMQRALYHAIVQDDALYGRCIRFLLWDYCRTLVRRHDMLDRRRTIEAVEQSCALTDGDAEAPAASGEASGGLSPDPKVSPRSPLSLVREEETTSVVSPGLMLSPPPPVPSAGPPSGPTRRQEQLLSVADGPVVSPAAKRMLLIRMVNGKQLEHCTKTELQAYATSLLRQGGSNLIRGAWLQRLIQELPGNATPAQAGLTEQAVQTYYQEARRNVTTLLFGKAAAIR